MAKRPVVLVHGMLGQQHVYWNLFRHRLERDGWTVHEAVLPYYLLGDLEEASHHLCEQVERFLRSPPEKRTRDPIAGPLATPSAEEDAAQHPAARVDLVCHSAGGLVARHALRTLGDKVGHLVMMGTANQGTQTAHLLAALPFVRMAAQARPQSRFLHDLAKDPVDPKRIHNLWSRIDGIVLPPSNAQLPGADNVELAWTGHWMFLWSATVYAKVKGILETDA